MNDKFTVDAMPEAFREWLRRTPARAVAVHRAKDTDVVETEEDKSDA